MIIDITKRSICDGCDKTTSKQNPVDYWILTIGTKKVSLCEDCLRVLSEKIDKIITKIEE